MRKKSKNILFLILVLVVFILGSLTYSNWPHCTKINFIDASVSVKAVAGKGLLGFNTDDDSLAFGSVSPAAQVIRSINIQYSRNALVTVTIDGDLASWVRVDPFQFYLPAQENKLVFFELNVPAKALDGDYNGKVKFCFRE